MGSVLRVPIISSTELEADIDSMVKQLGVRLLAAVTDPSAAPFDQIERPVRMGLVLGEEDRGIDETWLAKCHQCITIPMRKRAGSLNVAVAAGILIHGLA
jgi:tRNA G18 (ribose-2'-O)-methylase SpoU